MRHANKKGKKRGQPYRTVFEKLAVRNMTVWDLADAVERKTGKFVNVRRLKKRLKTGQKVGSWVYCAIKEILDIQDASTD